MEVLYPAFSKQKQKKTDQPNLSKNKGKYSRKGTVHICVTLSMGIYGLKLSKGQEHGKMEFPSPLHVPTLSFEY
jgi:hypothetical protein